MVAAGVQMYLHHTKPTLLRVGDDNRCAISLGKEDEEFADTMRLAVALTSPVAILRAIRLRTIVIYLHIVRLSAHHHSIIGGTRSTDKTDQWRKTVSKACGKINAGASQPRHQPPTPAGKGKTATTTKIKKKQPRGRSRSDGATRNRSRSKPRLSGTRSSESEWITYDDAAHSSNSSHQ
eukprot:jgi/Tetstr1/443159/TSEL_031199.t1